MGETGEKKRASEGWWWCVGWRSVRITTDVRRQFGQTSIYCFFQLTMAFDRTKKNTLFSNLPRVSDGLLYPFGE